MTVQLCVVDGCRILGQHQPGCETRDTDDCRGCLPRVAHEGHTCDPCLARTRDKLAAIITLADDARAVARGEVRRGAGGTSGKPGSRPPLNDGATDSLAEVQNLLTTIARDIAETRGVSYP